MSVLTEENRKATYLGDGVYVNIVNGDLEIFTSNGVTKDNSIFLDNNIVDNLVNFRNTAKAEAEQASQETNERLEQT